MPIFLLLNYFINDMINSSKDKVFCMRKYRHICRWFFVFLIAIGVYNLPLQKGETTSVLVNNVNYKAGTPASIKSVKAVNNADVIQIVANQGSSAIDGYYVGATFNSSVYYKTTATSINVSAMNGTQYVWVKDAQGNLSSPASITISNSCTDQKPPTNATGIGQFEKCFVYSSTNGLQAISPGVFSCADGWALTGLNTNDHCSTVTNQVLAQFNLGAKYCSRVYNYTCQKTSTEVVTSYLSNLKISSGTLSPAFKATTYNYSASVNVSAINVEATLNSDGSSFVEGFGSRTVKLNYGVNNIQVKVKSKTGVETTYTIKVTRIDNRSKDNTLADLKTNVGALSPSFNPATTGYTVNVPYGTTAASIEATIKDSTASFVSGFGPRTVDLKEGNNDIAIKVKAESGATRTYTVRIVRATNTDGPAPIDDSDLALLESLELSEGNISFDSKIYEYTVYVNYEVTQVIATAKPKNKDDIVTITGGDNLVVDVESQIIVNVEDTTHNFSRNYTINVIRKEENNDVSSNSEVSDIKIEKHNIKFEQSQERYNITLNKNETKLNISVTPEDNLSTVTIKGNEDLKLGSEIEIVVTAEDGSETKYYIEIDGVKEGTNVFLVIVLIILIIIVIGYIVLRLMGYKVYFNLSVIGSFFRSIGEKIKNIFDR